MAKCVSDAVEGTLRKLKTEVMRPQINQKNEEIKALKTEIAYVTNRSILSSPHS